LLIAGIFSLLKRETQFNCDPVFQEDLEPLKASDYRDQEAAKNLLSVLPPRTDSSCMIKRNDVLWGRNFVPDDEFIAVVSAVLTRAKPDTYEAIEAIRL